MKKWFRPIVLMLLSVMVMVALAACGGEPVTMSSIPVFPNTTPLQAGQNSMADTLAGTLESMVGDQLSSEINLYAVPATTTWAEVQDFYTTQLADTDWKAAEELTQETSAINIMGWSRGGLASEQVLVVGHSPDLLGNGAFLIVGLFSE